jgi:uncharacterized membrane protein YdjX (TVP38/TMEM64 family)
MHAQRAYLIEHLRTKDPGGKLKAWWPDAGHGDSPTVHTKLTVVDDCLAYLGSANLLNRSMGFDTEIGLVMDAEMDPQLGGAIKGLRRPLLAEHLDATVDDLARAEESDRSLIEAVLRACGQATAPCATWRRRTIPSAQSSARSEGSSTRSARPILARSYTAARGQQTMRAKTTELARLALPFVIVAALALAWRSETMRSILESLPDHMERLATVPAAEVLVVGIFVLAGCIAVPLSALVVATAATFGPIEGALVAWIGATLSALLVFAVGRMTGREFFQSTIGAKGRDIADRIVGKGVVAVAVLRNLPVAPFSVVNLAAGASPIRFWDFALGTLIGLIPGIAMMALVGGRLMNVFRSPSPTNLAVFGAALLLSVVIGLIAARQLESQESDEADEG